MDSIDWTTIIVVICTSTLSTLWLDYKHSKLEKRIERLESRFQGLVTYLEGMLGLKRGTIAMSLPPTLETSQQKKK